MTPDAVVIGAGFAGLSAAVRLAQSGRRVVVFEEAPRLGGRATAFVDRASGERVDNGQHAFFGCYRETFAFLDAIGTSALVPLAPRLSLTMAGPDGARARLRCPPLPAPWHLVAGLLTWPAVGLADRLAAARLLPLLREVRRRGAAAVAAEVPAGQTVTDWLRARGQPQALEDWLWNPLAVAALNQPPAEAAAAPFVRVLGELFAPDPRASAIGLPTVPLDDLYAHPARDFIVRHGGQVRVRAPAVIHVADAGVVAVESGGERMATTAVVAAVPWFAFDRLWPGAPPAPMAPVVERARAMAASPIVTVNLWIDGPGLSEPFVGLVGGPMHWVFNKRAIFGPSSAHLSVVSSGVKPLAALDNESVTRAAWAQLGGALPELAGRQLLRSVVVREQRATFSLAPGQPPRPGPVTPIAGLFLAGDWADTGLPGTIEGAVSSGHRAAAACLGDRALPG